VFIQLKATRCFMFLKHLSVSLPAMYAFRLDNKRMRVVLYLSQQIKVAF